MKRNLLLLLAAVACFTGCRTYNYRIVRPSGYPQLVGQQSVAVRYDPLEYQLSSYKGHLAMRIVNPTDERIVLRGDRSYVIDPKGETHPIPAAVIGPHSYTRMLLPPRLQVYPYTDWNWRWGGGWGIGWGQAWGTGWDDPLSGTFYGYPFYYPTTDYYRQETPYDWDWTTGPAQLQLSYEHEGKTFEQNFEFACEPKK